MIEIVILGVGHSESIIHYNPSLLVNHKGRSLLVDCGYTTKAALANQGLSFNDIDSILISHTHGDHCYGLERAAYELLFKHKKRVNLYIIESIYNDLWEHTLKGSLSRIGEGEMTLEDYFNVQIVKDDDFQIDSLSVRKFKNNHTPNMPSYGFVFNEKILYSGDTTSIPEIVNRLDFTIGIHDVTLSKSNPVHATLSSIINDYHKNKKDKIYLISYEDHYTAYEELVEEHFRGFAKQGMRLKVE